MIEKTQILYTFKKSYHISYNKYYFCCVGSSVHLYDINNGELLYEFKDIKHPICSRFASEQTLVVKTMVGSYNVYNLTSMSLVKTISLPKKVLSSTTSFQITSDNKYIIDFSYSFPNYELMFINIETGTYSFLDLGYSRKGFVFTTENDSKYYLLTSCAETIDAPDVDVLEYYELTYISDKFKLQKLFFENHSKVAIADYNSNKFAIADYYNKIKIFDAKRIFIDEFEYDRGVLYDLKFSKNGQYIALVESQNIYIYDLNKKKYIKVFEVENGCFVDFLDDSKLLIGTWKKGYCLYLKDTNYNTGD